MATIKITAKRCDEFNCPYLTKEQVYSPDPFEGSYYVARCIHDKAPDFSKNSLGSDDSNWYCEIPEWCPIKLDNDNQEWKKQLIETINQIDG